MSYTTARAQIVSILTGLTPVVVVGGLGVAPKFSHDPKGTETRPGAPGRRFWLATGEGGSWSPSPQWTRRSVTLQLVVEYPPTPAQTDELDLLIVEDYDLIAKTMLDGGNWSRATSRIVSIAGGPQGRLLPFRVERGPQGTRLRVSMVVEYDGAAYVDPITYDADVVYDSTTPYAGA